MDSFGWRTTFTDTLRQLVERTSAFVPNLVAAAILLLLGWVVASIARVTVEKLLGVSLRRLARTPHIHSAVERSGVQKAVPWLASAFVYWIILLFFAAAAVERLELTVATDLVTRLAFYLPNVLLGLLLIFVGIVTGGMARTAIARAGATAGMAQAPLLGRTAEILIIFVSVVVGVDQVGIQSTLLMLVVTVMVAVVFGGVALAFGLGSGTAVSNLISSRYVARSYRPGQTVSIDGIQGRVLEITPTGVILDSSAGRVLIPARKFSEQASILIAGED